MKKIEQYIESLIGADAHIEPMPKRDFGRIPMYINEIYRLFNAEFLNQELLLVAYKNEEDFSIAQLTKHFQLLSAALNKKVVLVIDRIETFNRVRLMHNKINFIIPQKQLFLPELLISLKENLKPQRKEKKEKLLPSAQFILLYYLLHRYENKKIEEYTFKELAAKFRYTQMAITKAVENLKQFELCTVEGSKEKYLHFKFESRKELWGFALPFMVNPVLKKMYVDEKPNKLSMLLANDSALPKYTNMNPSRQQYYAIEKTDFYALLKNNGFKNLNENEGQYCLEVWKYDPSILTEGLAIDEAVDQLSLYLSMKDNADERTEAALETLIDNSNLW